MEYEIEPGCTIRVLSPEDSDRMDDLNEGSLVLLSEYGRFRALMRGDAGTPVEDRLVGSGTPLAAQVLKVGHHGSPYSTGDVFLSWVMPEVAVIPVGAGNDYGHPSPEVVRRLEWVGAAVFRTDRDGTVTLYYYNPLKRLVATTRNGVTESNLLDPDGRVLVKLRMAGGVTNQILEKTAYDTSGRITSLTNALLGVTPYVYGWTNGQSYRQTTRPEGGARIEIFFRDGTVNRILGSAARPVRYDYDVETDGGLARYFSYERKLDASGNDLAQ
jgi:YD repeat-containing protein